MGQPVPISGILNNKAQQPFVSFARPLSLHTGKLFLYNNTFGLTPETQKSSVCLHAAIQPAEQTPLSLCPAHHLPVSSAKKQSSSLVLNCSQVPSLLSPSL